MKTNVKGISLIILVISIVVLAIFGGVVLVTIDNNNLINYANNTANLDKINNIKEALNLSYNKLKIQYMNDSSLITQDSIKQNALEYGVEESELNDYLMRIIDDVVYLGETDNTVTSSDTINSAVDMLVNYKIYGNSVQSGNPSPETPIEIQNVGDRITNLFDINSGFAKNAQYTATTINGTEIITPYSASNILSAEFNQYIPVEENVVYTCKFELKQGSPRILIKLYDETKQIIDDNSISISGFTYNTFYQGYYADVSEKNIIFPSNVKYIRFCTVAMNGQQGVNNIYSNFQFVKGNTAIEYEQNGKYKIPIIISGKNLLNPSYWSSANTAHGLTIQYSQEEDVFVLNGTTEIGADYYIYYFNLPVKKGSNYTLSVNYVSGNINKPSTSPYAVAYIGANDNINTHINFINTPLTNSDNNRTGICNYEYITAMWFYISAGVTFDNYKVKIQLEENTKATAYEPYKAVEKYNIYLDEPLRKVEEYADYIDFENQRIVRQVNKIDLKDYTWYSNNPTTVFYYINKVSPAPITSTSRYAMSNILPATYIGSENSNVGVNAYTSGIIRVRPDLTVYDTLDKWVDYVNDNESYLLYPTADRFEKVELPKIDITSGTTIITIDTEISPSKTVLEYLYK